MTHDQLGFISSWDNLFPLLILFILVYLIFNKRSQGAKKTPKQAVRKAGKVIDLEQFRQRRELQGKETAQEQEKKNSWVTLYSTSNPANMDLVHSLLTSYNINCNITNRHSATLYPSIDGLNMILQVRSEEQQRCLEILKEHDLSVDEL
jgi:hypothetical protein